ncbi:MAG: DUF4384 domain-containing protein [Elusimicrobia bacterium]|nr:DUF4384 domain-containing protein [Elusimicrobiota bacterium]
MKLFRLIVAAIIAAACTAPTRVQETPSNVESIDAGIAEVALDVLPAIRGLDGKLCVLDFIPASSDKTFKSDFGRLVAEKLSAELVRRRASGERYAIVERTQLVRIMDDVDSWGENPRLIEGLRRMAGMDYLVSGSYEVVDDEVAVTAKVIKASDGSVKASGKTHWKLTPGLERLIHRQEKAAESIAMEAALVYKGAEDNKLRLVHEGMTLTERNSYGLYLRPAQDCWVYVYQADSRGKVSRLFPNPDFHTGSNFLLAGDEHWVPNETDLFELDTATGTETVYIVASREELPPLTSLSTARTGEFKSKLTSLNLMGVKGVVSTGVQRARPLKRRVEDIFTEQLKATANFYSTISFEHR